MIGVLGVKAMIAILRVISLNNSFTIYKIYNIVYSSLPLVNSFVL